MRVLLTNDDGLRAPGIVALWDALADPRGAGHGRLAGLARPEDLVVAAPLTVQSATGHGITFHEPLMVREETVAVEQVGFAIDGRPADCVKLALSSLWPERFGEGSRPDLVVSGLNMGANVGINVLYSGTVAAALEAAFLGVPSIAVSLHLGAGRPRYDVAARHARAVIERLLAGGLQPHECLSINLPITESERPLPKIRVCAMNVHGHVDRYERRVSPRGDVYYWASGNGHDFQGTEPGSDVDELFEGHVTVTPLRYDLTASALLQRWRERLPDSSAS